MCLIWPAVAWLDFFTVLQPCFSGILAAPGHQWGSMSERRQCWDNAPAESFWATLKRETLPLSGCFSSRKEARDTEIRWIIQLQWNSAPFAAGDAIPLSIQIKGASLVIRAFLSKFCAHVPILNFHHINTFAPLGTPTIREE